MSSNDNPPQPSKAPLEPPPDVTSALDLEANQLTQPPPRRRAPFIPGFRNPTPFLVFLRRDWYDIATQLLCLLIAFLLYSLVPPIMPRYFPLYSGIEKSAWGMKHSQPYLAEYITTVVSAIVSFVVPALIMGAIALWGTRSFEDGNAAVSLTAREMGTGVSGS
jgi:diacylglycerol diphosphate phosphatase/phosphatidate phosphatase